MWLHKMKKELAVNGLEKAISWLSDLYVASVDSLKKFFFKVYLFILRESDQGRAAREGERESQAGSTLSTQSPMWGLNSRNVRS